MSLEDHTSEYLFSYGTLQLEAVQLATFGRTFVARHDALIGYRITMVQIQDEHFIAKNGSAPQRSLEYTGAPADVVEGTILELTRNELEQADTYEPAEYKRQLVQLQSGVRAWVYFTNF
jgi:hypothetical protein